MTASAPPSHPELAEATAMLRALVDTLSSTPAPLAAGIPDAAAAEMRLANGVPALTGEPLLTGRALLRNAVAVGERLRGTSAGAQPARILEALTRAAPDLDSGALVPAALEARLEPIEALGAALRVDAAALATILEWAVRPALRAGARRLVPLLAATNWMRGYCPACGGAPAISVMSGKERERRLHCGRCTTAWAFPRLRCPACGETDHARLGYLHAEGESEYRRAEVCDGCRTYVKSVALLDTPDAGRIVELDLETAALDFLALDGGYRRGGATS